MISRIQKAGTYVSNVRERSVENFEFILMKKVYWTKLGLSPSSIEISEMPGTRRAHLS